MSTNEAETTASESETDTKPAEPPARKPRGFAAMDPAIVTLIARQGGKAAHQKGVAHEFSSEEARAAGRKGGRARDAQRRAALGIPPSSNSGGGEAA